MLEMLNRFYLSLYILQLDLVDSYCLVYSIPVLSVPTHYSDIQGYTNIVIDLILLDISCALVSHYIKHNFEQPSDHASLIFDFSITLENIYMYRIVLKYNSNEGVV